MTPKHTNIKLLRTILVLETSQLSGVRADVHYVNNYYAVSSGISVNLGKLFKTPSDTRFLFCKAGLARAVSAKLWWVLEVVVYNVLCGSHWQHWEWGKHRAVGLQLHQRLTRAVDKLWFIPDGDPLPPHQRQESTQASVPRSWYLWISTPTVVKGTRTWEWVYPCLRIPLCLCWLVGRKEPQTLRHCWWDVKWGSHPSIHFDVSTEW